MKTEVTEFTPWSEHVTATIHMTALPNSEAYQGPMHIGYYVKQDEIFVECEDTRINIPRHLIDSVIKQLRRAVKLAKEHAE